MELSVLITITVAKCNNNVFLFISYAYHDLSAC